MSEILFDGQREGEKVKLVFRRHIRTARKGLLWLLVMIAIGVLMMVGWPGNATMFWVFLGCVAVGLLGAGYSYMLWYFSVYIVTNERIRQINQRGLFTKSVVDLGLDKIQSISYKIPGVWAGMTGFGTILIQTTVGDMVISQVSKPEKTYNKLQNIMRKAEKEQG